MARQDSLERETINLELDILGCERALFLALHCGQRARLDEAVLDGLLLIYGVVADCRRELQGSRP